MTKKHKKKAGETMGHDPDKEFAPEESADDPQTVFVDPPEHLLAKDAQDGSISHEAPPDDLSVDPHAADAEVPEPGHVSRIVTPAREAVPVRGIPSETETQRTAGKVSGNRDIAHDATQPALTNDLPEGPDAFRVRK